jgi:hypothetical protein
MCRLPLLFVDIDGVISLWGFPPDERPDGAWNQVDGIAHFLSTTAARSLHELSEHYELVWCSGWEERANDHLPHLLGLGPFPHLGFDRDVGGGAAGSRAHWKLEAIEAHAGDRPLAWIDDAFNDACHAWAAARPAPTLRGATDPARGLTATESERLRAWAAARPGAA